MSSSSLSLLISLATAGVYGYAAYYMLFNPHLKKMHALIAPSLRPYGQLKFLTFQCLLIQVVNSLLHVVAHFISPLRKIRDLWFTTLAYPVGSIVVYSFWGVWFTFGRELIFPVALSQFYPDWLNHVTHTIIVFVNLLMAFLVHHRYSRNSAALTVVYLIGYTALLYYIKMQSGFFVYAYLETIQEPFRALYFVSTGLIAYLLYKSGQLLDSIFHSQPSQRPTTKKTKQK